MNELERDDALTLHTLEDLMNMNMPRICSTRGEVFDFLKYSVEQLLAE